MYANDDNTQRAREAGAEVINYEENDDLIQLLKDLTGNLGPDSCCDAVGMEASGHTLPFKIYRAKQIMRLSFDCPNVFRQCIMACRKDGTISRPGVYGGLVDKIPFGQFMNKGLTLKTGQTHMMRYMKPLPGTHRTTQDRSQLCYQPPDLAG